MQTLSVVIFFLTVASLAYPPLGQFVINMLAGAWGYILGVLRRLPAPLGAALGVLPRILIGLAILYLVMWVVSALLVTTAFAFHEPWAAWAGFLMMTGLVGVFMIFRRPRQGARTIATTLVFLALVFLGTMITGISGRTATLIATFAILWLLSSSMERRHRRLMLGFSILIIAVSLGSSLTPSLPAPISEAVENLQSVSTFAIADAIRPDVPGGLLEAKEDGRRQFLANELVHYRTQRDALLAIQKTRSLTSAEWADLAEAEAQVTRIEEELANKLSLTILYPWLFVFGVVVLLAVVIWFIFLNREAAAVAIQQATQQPPLTTGSAAQATSAPPAASTPAPAPAATPTNAQPPTISHHSPSINWRRWAMIAATVAAVVVVGYLVWLNLPTPRAEAATQATTQPASIAEKVNQRMKISSVKEDTELYNQGGNLIVVVPKGTIVAYDPQADLVNIGRQTMIPATVANDKGNFVNAQEGLIPGHQVELDVPPPPAPPATAAATPIPDRVYTFYLRNNSSTPIDLWWRTTRGQDKKWTGTGDVESIMPGGIVEQEGSLSPGQWVIKDLAGNELRVFAQPTADGSPANPMLYP